MATLHAKYTLIAAYIVSLFICLFQTDYAKCDCLLSEVEQLNELGYLRETELTQRAKITEEQVTKLVSMMEQKKEEVEVATHMYKFIDQVNYVMRNLGRKVILKT